jgi:PAS domain S-box-containing protein
MKASRNKSGTGDTSITKQKLTTEEALQASEARFRRFTEATVEGLVFHEQGRIVDANPAALAMFGLSDNTDFIGRNLLEFIVPESHELVLKQMQLETVLPYEIQCIHKTGRIFPMETSTRTYKDGERIIRASSIRDITERKQAEAALRESEERFRAIYDNATIGLYRTTPDGRLLMINPAGIRMMGYDSFDEIAKLDVEKAGYEQDGARREFREKIEREGYVVDFENKWKRKDGSTIFVRESAKTIRDESGKVLYYDGSFEDITERKRIEAELRESEERFRRFSDVTAEGLVFHEQGKIVDVNMALITMFGYSNASELIGKNLMEFIAPEARAEVVKQLQSGSSLPYEAAAIRKDGSIFPVEAAGRLYEHEGRIIRVGSIRDITERKRTEETLDSSLSLLRATLESTADAILVVNRQGKVESYNKRFLELWHIPQAIADSGDDNQLLGYVVGQLRDPGAFAAKVQELYSQPEAESFDVLEFQDGRFFERYSRPQKTEKEILGRVWSFRDITERKRAEEELQRLASIIQNSSELVNLASLDGKMIFLNEAGSSMLGINLADVAQHTVMEVIPEQWLGMVQSELLPTVMEKGRWEGDLQYRNIQTNVVTDVHTLAFVIKDAETSAPLYLANISLDITERKQAEEELQRLASIIQNSSELVNLSTLDGKMVFLNEAGSRMLGINPSELGQHSIVEVIPEQWLGMVQSELLPTVMEKGRWEGDLQYRNIQTNIVTDVHALAFVIKDAETGAPLYLANVSLDITERKNLEQQIQTAFERRGYQVQVSTEISQEIASVSDVNDLFGRVVTLTKERLGYYHTQLLRYDPAQDAVVLINGYGEIGQEMLAGGHKLPMGTGLIGTAAASGQTVMRSTLAEDPDWRPNPLLPETKGEIAVPIKWQGTVLGVLDVQSDQAGALTEDDRLLLEGLCGQIAVAMEQTRLRQEMAERLEEVNRLYRTMSYEGWKAYRETADLPAGFVYDQSGIKPVDEAVLADESFADISMRVLGGEVVGTLAVANDPRHPTTTEDQVFLQQVSDQIALALESARLFEQTQSALAQSESLFDASRRLTQAADLQELVKAVVETLHIPVINRAILGAFSYNAAGELETMTDVANWWNGTGTEVAAVGTSYSADTLKLLQVFLSDIPLFFNDTFHDERMDPAGLQVAKSLNIRAAAVLPLFLGTRQLGILMLQAEEPHNFTQDETRLYSALAPQIATVMENRRQFERAQKQAERESTLNVISQKIQSATTVEAVLQIAARELGHALGAPMTIAQLSMKDKK